MEKYNLTPEQQEKIAAQLRGLKGRTIDLHIRHFPSRLSALLDVAMQQEGFVHRTEFIKNVIENFIERTIGITKDAPLPTGKFKLKPLLIKFPLAYVDRIDLIAARQGSTRSELIRRATREFTDKYFESEVSSE